MPVAAIAVPDNENIRRGFQSSISESRTKRLGRKIAVMREQPQVCFEIEEFDECASWRSVIAEGRYEEICDDAARDAVLRLLNTTSAIGRGRNGHGVYPIVVFRIRLTEKSGRFERLSA